jgi:hypothetical protein
MKSFVYNLTAHESIESISKTVFCSRGGNDIASALIAILEKFI